ncbi:hypothetical protein CCMA1212_010536 [Trichoderma ghanense]|uniref:Uncharacterized protein n=1 Tax=Trichoderma ghanense TaxID=65468 RepID=A0ABY2GR83_9HYPO
MDAKRNNGLLRGLRQGEITWLREKERRDNQRRCWSLEMADGLFRGRTMPRLHVAVSSGSGNKSESGLILHEPSWISTWCAYQKDHPAGEGSESSAFCWGLPTRNEIPLTSPGSVMPCLLHPNILNEAAAGSRGRADGACANQAARSEHRGPIVVIA